MPSNFGSMVNATQPNNFLQGSILVTANLNSTGNTFLQALDANSLALLEAGFGDGPSAMPSNFGSMVNATQPNNFIQGSGMASSSLNSNGKKFVQSLKTNSLELLEAGFGAGPSAMPSNFGSMVNATQPNNFIQGSVLLSANLNSTGNTFLQSLDANSLKLLEAGFGAGPSAMPSNFGSMVNATQPNNFIQGSILLSATLNSTGNTFLQSLDANSLALLEAGFGAGPSAMPSNFGSMVNATQPNNFIQGSILLSANLNSTGNTFVQTLDANSLALLEAGFGAGPSAMPSNFGSMAVASQPNNFI